MNPGEKKNVLKEFMFHKVILSCPIRDGPDPGDRCQWYSELGLPGRSQLYHCWYAGAGGLEVQAGETSGACMCQNEFIPKPKEMKANGRFFTTVHSHRGWRQTHKMNIDIHTHSRCGRILIPLAGTASLREWRHSERPSGTSPICPPPGILS